MFKKIIISLFCLIFLIGYITTPIAKANSWAAEFADESMAAYFGSVVTTVTAVGAGVNNAQDFVAEYGHDIYNTAKETWSRMSADMQAKFKDSMSQMADGIIVVGDWITDALDNYKSDFGATTPNVGGTVSDTTYYLSSGYTILVNGKSVSNFNVRGVSYASDSPNNYYIQYYVAGNLNQYLTKWFNNATDFNAGKAMADSMIKSINSAGGAISVLSYFGATATLQYDGVPVEGNSTYNRIDEWLRDVAIPAGNLGVYAPSEAWTTNGYRLGLSEDGQQLLTLPDGLPYDPTVHGQYSWRQPLTRVIDGVPAVLNPTTWDWVNARDKTIVRPAEIPEIAEYVGTDVDTAEKIKENTKGKEEETPGSCPKLKKPNFKPFTTGFTTGFPFSIPWDIARIIDGAFGGIGSKKPEFDLNPLIPAKLTIPDYFDSWMPFVRTLILLAFDAGLIYLFARFMGRGGGD